ncbi:hypothetical protein [Telmatospirillum sp.]|uniref:hypothetical protein n=1 Tax=Telmatospirillum sp. TaxID=2079197 RepID=UPI00283B0266|nr:hypothetical protein [Telmatospirillum sp.]MDR3436958.1 hypothetical protein [Telmatospirillum sp.]
MTNLYRKSGGETSRRAAAQSELDAKMEDFLSKGGKIIKCEPGPSDGVVLKRNGRMMQGRPRTAEKLSTVPDAPKKDEG